MGLLKIGDKMSFKMSSYGFKMSSCSFEMSSCSFEMSSYVFSENRGFLNFISFS